MSNSLNVMLGSLSKRVRTFAYRYKKLMDYCLAILPIVVTKEEKLKHQTIQNSSQQ